MTVFSRFLFDTLDSIGYSQEVIRLRRNSWQQCGDVLRETEHYTLGNIIIAGSKAEGLTSFAQSDIDTLLVSTDTICTDNVAQFSQIPGMTVLHTDTSVTSPGYMRLKLVRINEEAVNDCMSVLKGSAFEAESHDVYLSSSLFATSSKCLFEQINGNNSNSLSGPAFQFYVEYLSFDVVVGFFCYYPHLLQSWKIRRRYHEWPHVHVIEEAASLLAQVVPVGSKGSCDQWREWRFCFIESEQKLTYSLNETQCKLYIVLKMVAKEILRQVSDEISSYIMKNVVYWLSEILPLPVFRCENLFTLVLLSLRFLKSAISEWNWFPYYMIPGRNLLAERLTPVNRRQLSGLIETLINEGPHFLLRCTKLRAALNVRLQTPALLIRYRKTRDQLELLAFCYLLGDLQNDETIYTMPIEHGLCDDFLSELMIPILQGVPEEHIIAMILEMLS